MMLQGINNTYNNYNNYSSYTRTDSNVRNTGKSAGNTEAAETAGVLGVSQDNDDEDGRVIVRNPGASTEKKAGRKSSPAECKTCKERKYQDGSDENVSYKSPTNISPSASAASVKSHEQEHVSNAYTKAAQNNGKVVSCNVTLKTSVCPECGRTYVAGGETATQIKYYNEENPYQQDMKSSDAANKYLGANVDIAC
jgi:hypothetical protein